MITTVGFNIKKLNSNRPMGFEPTAVRIGNSNQALLLFESLAVTFLNDSTTFM